jgi:hypothetical protein
MRTIAKTIVRALAALALAAATSTAFAGEAGLVRDASGHFRTPVMIGDRGPYDFVVDTGAATTVVMQRLVDDLHAAPILGGGGLRVQGASGSAAVSNYRFANVRNGTFSTPELVAPMISTSPAASSAPAPRGRRRPGSRRSRFPFASAPSPS